jgi:capsular polysaccharide transport system permease protein
MKRLLSLASAQNLRLAVIAGPWVLAAIYLLIFAADRYVAESVIAVRENAEAPVIGVDALSSLFGTSGAASREDELMLEAHILSMDMLRQLDAKLDLRQAFSAPRADWIYRAPRSATQEGFLNYYRNRVEVIVDDRSGLLRIRTQGFTPALAAALNAEIIAISERFINESSHRLAREQMAFAESELDKGRTAVNKARHRLLAFQGQHGVLDPIAQVAANSGLTAELQATLARQEAELKSLLGFLNDDAHQVQGLKAQIAGTQAQLQTESLRAMSSANGTSLNVLAGDYQELAAELAFAQDAYKLALAALENARIESTRKLKSLVLVESPVQPESAEYPRRAYTLFALLVGLAVLYGIVRLVVATIEDHQE